MDPELFAVDPVAKVAVLAMRAEGIHRRGRTVVVVVVVVVAAAAAAAADRDGTLVGEGDGTLVVVHFAALLQ